MICNTFSLIASFSSTCCCQAKARNAPCTSRDTTTEKRLRKNLEPSIHPSCLMMKVETLNPTNGRKNLYLIKTGESLSRSFQYWWKERTLNHTHHHLGRWQWSHRHLLLQNYALMEANFHQVSRPVSLMGTFSRCHSMLTFRYDAVQSRHWAWQHCSACHQIH